MKQDRTLLSKFKKLWKFYLLQSFMAGVILLIIALILGETKMVVISAIGATTFIVFAMPNAVSAKVRNIIGGHLVGLATGTLLSLMTIPNPIGYALAVAITMFLMVALDVEHPPAAGTALAVLVNQVSLDALLTILVSILVLSLAHRYLRNYFRDLV
jgi:CBS-domain-containing membrane protein